jgi:hypothetical protein
MRRHRPEGLVVQLQHGARALDQRASLRRQFDRAAVRPSHQRLPDQRFEFLYLERDC